MGGRVLAGRAVLATAGHDATVRLWDAATGTQIAVETHGRTGVRSVAFSPGGTILASAGQGRAVRLWNADTGVQMRVLCGAADGFMDVAFSPTRALSVRIGNAIASIATGDGVMAIGFDRDVACLQVLEAGEQPNAVAPASGAS